MLAAPQVRYLTKRQIETSAERVLAAYHGDRPVRDPVPVEEILELHLGLTLEYLDMPKLFGGADVLGALWVPAKRVAIDHSLDPDRFPAMEGRHHFTLAHEIGHWVLHRDQILADARQKKLFVEVERPNHVCRTTQAAQRIEWQANYFAACLLMPAPLVRHAWEQAFGPDPIPLTRLRAFDWAIIDVPQLIELARGESRDRVLLNYIARRLNRGFRVSTEAMRIRLEELGLLLTRDDLQRQLA